MVPVLLYVANRQRERFIAVTNVSFCARYRHGEAATPR